MNVVKNILSNSRVQRPAKATSIQSLEGYIFILPLAALFLIHKPLSLAPQKCQSESKQLIRKSTKHALASGSQTVSSMHRCPFVTSLPSKVNLKDYGELWAAVKMHKVWLLLRKWAL